MVCKKHVLLALNSEMLISLVVLLNFDGDSWDGWGRLQMGTRGYAVGADVCARWMMGGYPGELRLDTASDLLLMCPSARASTHAC